MTKDEALKMAIEAIENADFHNDLQAMAFIKEMLAQREQEPVAFASHGVVNWIADKQFQHEAHLYSAPQRTWVGLTDEEIWETISRIGTSDSDVNPYAKLADARDIEAKLRSKNT
jgi:hypothetical protein